MKRTAADGYHVSLGRNDYVWGSNGVAANYGLQLIVANALSPNARYREAAADNLHYLLGRNTFSVSWVTQVGANPYPAPAPSAQRGGPERGTVAGARVGRPVRAARIRRWPSCPTCRPQRCLDEQESYATNGIAINWNAPLVFVLADQAAREAVGRAFRPALAGLEPAVVGAATATGRREVNTPRRHATWRLVTLGGIGLVAAIVAASGGAPRTIAMASSRTRSEAAGPAR